jgi:thiamine pyrophosphate-dependent acetolactate synthase large subunit-like protein
MKLGAAIAEIMKREGIEILCGYPVNHLIEFAANADIRPIMVRQERIGLHMADAISRMTSGRSIGAFCMQHGPGAENAMGGVAQWAMRAGSPISSRISIPAAPCAPSPNPPSRSRWLAKSATSSAAPSRN